MKKNNKKGQLTIFVPFVFAIAGAIGGFALASEFGLSILSGVIFGVIGLIIGVIIGVKISMGV